MFALHLVHLCHRTHCAYCLERLCVCNEFIKAFLDRFVTNSQWTRDKVTVRVLSCRRVNAQAFHAPPLLAERSIIGLINNESPEKNNVHPIESHIKREQLLGVVDAGVSVTTPTTPPVGTGWLLMSATVCSAESSSIMLIFNTKRSLRRDNRT